jgi:hypothetical protein
MKTLKYIVSGFIACLAAVSLTGCASQKTWVYHANSYASMGTSTDKKIAILPFEDLRENENQNIWGIGYIPLVPYGPQNLNTPEGIDRHTTSGMWINYKPTEDFSKALAEDLRNTRMFSDAFFDYRRENGDYAVKGKILNTKYEGRIITYCVSFAASYLWLVGFPAAWTQNDLSVELTLEDSRTEKILFSKTYTAKTRSGCSWLYSFNNDFHYSEMLAEVNKQFCTDIQPIFKNAKNSIASKQ